MDIVTQKYYEDRQAMTGGKAWRDLMDDVGVMMAATDTLSGVTADTLQFKQGELSIMRWLLNIAEVSNQAYEDLKE
jgi:hypothetical protein